MRSTTQRRSNRIYSGPVDTDITTIYLTGPRLESAVTFYGYGKVFPDDVLTKAGCAVAARTTKG